MSDSQGAPLSASVSEALRPEIDVRAMPHILRRIVIMGWKTDRLQVLLAVGCSLGSAVASLLQPRIFGHAVDQVRDRLLALGQARHASAAAQAAMHSAALNALWVGAAMVIGVGIVQGVLTGLSGFQSEWVSQKVAYKLRLD
jgi:ATP-binding cassette subfamily B multidrug efflux pump